MLEPANSVRLYTVPPDYWGYIDDVTMGTVSVLGALATGHIGMFAALPFAFFAGLFPVMKAMGGGMIGRWVPLWTGIRQFAFGTQLSQADVIGGGIGRWGWNSLQWRPGNQHFALAGAGYAGVENQGRWLAITCAMLSICHLFYGSWESSGTIIEDMGEHGIHGVADVLAITADAAHDLVVRGGRMIGGIFGGAANEFGKQAPDAAAKIGSILEGGTMTMALVIGTMLAISGYNMMN
jgi:hypothetical protein